jgi:N-acetylglucosamine kinase-like BadF-type ATPase
VRGDGTLLGRGRGGAGNHILCGWETARGAIQDAIGEALTTAKLEASAVECAVAGSAGVGPNGEGREPIEKLLAQCLSRARVRAIGDMVTAFYGAIDSDFGVVVAAGTGSVGYGRSATGDGRQVGGWGHVMGDEGSAYDLAVRALRAGAQATDGRGPQTALCAGISAALGVDDFMGVALRVYGDPMSRDAIARLATAVAATAAAGDKVARELLAYAGNELAVTAVALLQALGLAEREAPVAFSGAVFDAGEAILEPFRRRIARSCPRAHVVRAAFPPVIGAFKLALQELGIAFTPNTAGRLRASAGSQP